MRMKLLFDGRPYIAVIGDIVASKTIIDRAAAQEKLSQTLNSVNAKYTEEIASKFMITLGDEFQGLLKTGAHAVDIAELIGRALYPMRVRFGIGAGPITTAINTERPLGADGPAYYHARAAISEIKVAEHKRMEPRSDIRTGVEGYSDFAEAVNTILMLNSTLKSRWAVRQREVITAYMENGGTQSDVARKLGIHQSSVQKALSHADFYAYLQALRTVSVLLSQIGETADV